MALEGGRWGSNRGHCVLLATGSARNVHLPGPSHLAQSARTSPDARSWDIGWASQPPNTACRWAPQTAPRMTMEGGLPRGKAPSRKGLECGLGQERGGGSPGQVCTGQALLGALTPKPTSRRPGAPRTEPRRHSWKPGSGSRRGRGVPGPAARGGFPADDWGAFSLPLGSEVDPTVDPGPRLARFPGHSGLSQSKVAQLSRSVQSCKTSTFSLDGGPGWAAPVLRSRSAASGPSVGLDPGPPPGWPACPRSAPAPSSSQLPLDPLQQPFSPPSRSKN